MKTPKEWVAHLEGVAAKYPGWDLVPYDPIFTLATWIHLMHATGFMHERYPEMSYRECLGHGGIMITTPGITHFVRPLDLVAFIVAEELKRVCGPSIH